MTRQNTPFGTKIIGKDSKLVLQPKKKKIIKIQPPMDRNKFMAFAVLTMLGIMSIYIACGVFLSIINTQH